MVAENEQNPHFWSFSELMIYQKFISNPAKSKPKNRKGLRRRSQKRNKTMKYEFHSCNSGLIFLLASAFCLYFSWHVANAVATLVVVLWLLTLE